MEYVLAMLVSFIVVYFMSYYYLKLKKNTKIEIIDLEISEMDNK